MTPNERHREGLERHYPKQTCALHGVNGHVCDGPIQADHIIAKQRLGHLQFEAKRQVSRGSTEAKVHTLARTSAGHLAADWRNGLWLCDRAHTLKTLRAVLLPREVLPPEADDFARDYGLEDELARVCERR